jgi:acyl-CoA reductase-like NAD-dependent aldehyde dehydrogenase
VNVAFVCGILSDPALAKGFLAEPTVFVDVRNRMRIIETEIFGPIF